MSKLTKDYETTLSVLVDVSQYARYFTLSDEGELNTVKNGIGWPSFAYVYVPELIIADIFPDKEVKSIAYQCFNMCYQMISVVIPDTVTTLGNQSFSGCTNMSSTTMSNSITAIPTSCFSSCKSLNLSLPDGVTSLGSGSFSMTSGVLNIPNSVTSIASGCFDAALSGLTVNIDNTTDAISGSPWSGNSATINWLR